MGVQTDHIGWTPFEYLAMHRARIFGRIVGTTLLVIGCIFLIGQIAASIMGIMFVLHIMGKIWGF